MPPPQFDHRAGILDGGKSDVTGYRAGRRVGHR
jgi:hypothetical protein